MAMNHTNHMAQTVDMTYGGGDCVQASLCVYCMHVVVGSCWGFTGLLSGDFTVGHKVPINMEAISSSM